MNTEEIKALIRKEGDYKAFEYRGFKCRILRNSGGLINLCGYVGLPEGHKWFGKGYDDIDVDVHGGLTYARNYLHKQPETDLWWIGFDCAHLGDIAFLEGNYSIGLETYKDMEFVENEIKEMVDQLVD